MQKEPINPWDWQNQFGFSQAWKVDNPGTVLEVSGQTSMSPDGDVLHPDDFESQVEVAFNNLRTVLSEAGASLQDVVKIGSYLTEQQHVETYSRLQSDYFQGFNPSQTLLIVEDLALPGLLVEVEATAYLES